jgi:dTDP-4-amino-4,6-dideoxygalactose transaminase
MTELQGAVSIAQLEKLPSIGQRRNRNGMRLLNALRGVPGVYVCLFVRVFCCLFEKLPSIGQTRNRNGMRLLKCFA